MESIIARALEYTLKYWLHSFSRDQFKLVGRTAQLSNLDINGDALHASLGLPPALHVATAKVGKLEITLPSVSNVQIEPIVIQIDRLDLVLEENPESETTGSSSSPNSSSSSGKGSGYGYADKIADGMTVEVGTVNLMLETRGGARSQAGATWTPPLASITIRNLLLYTTNANWQVVNLKEARDFSNDKKFIYVFKKLEWQSLSIDLLPHPDMFMDARLSSTDEKKNRDDDGAKRLFFGGERFLEGISGHAYITLQRTELNSPLGLEVQLHVTETVCPALSEPGLRALLRFMTGLYVCLNRGDVARRFSSMVQKRQDALLYQSLLTTSSFASKTLLELLMQSLLFSRVSVSDGEKTKNLSHVMIGGLFLRDTFSRPPCALIQPSMQKETSDYLHDPNFGEDFCPPIYPLKSQLWQFDMGVPLLSLRALQLKPSPSPPAFASETIIDCQPLMINLQEETCLRLASFLADGVVVGPGVVLPDFSVNSFVFALKEFDLTIPLDAKSKADFSVDGDNFLHTLFAGAKLHVEDLYFSQSPSLKCKLLNLDKDPACFSLWEFQPVDASQRKWMTQASHVSISLEPSSEVTAWGGTSDHTGVWKCVDLYESRFEAAMVTADGSPLLDLPPPEGIVRIGVACEQYTSNTSVEQLFFILELYTYFGRFCEKIETVTKSTRRRCSESFGENLLKKVPSDTAISLALDNLKLIFSESSLVYVQGMPLVQFVGQDMFLKVSHRTLGGAFAVSTNVRWENVHVDCVDTGVLTHEKKVEETSGLDLVIENGHNHQMRPVFWVSNQKNQLLKVDPFLDISTVHVMPYDAHDAECHSLTVSAIVSGVRLGGGMNYAEALLHRFGIFGPDGGPSEGLAKGLKNLSTGPLAKLFRASPLLNGDQPGNKHLQEGSASGFMKMGSPDDIDVAIELKNWLFALEGAQETNQRWLSNGSNINREEKCWHASFYSLKMKAKGTDMDNGEKSCKMKNFPVELITVGIEGLQAVKPLSNNDVLHSDSRITHDVGNGLDVEACLIMYENGIAEEARWSVDNIKFAVKQPIEVVVKKEELEHLADLFKSEVDSMGRIAAGILRLLKLEESLGHTALDQLSNLGSSGLDKVFTPEKLSRRSSFGSISFTPTAAATNESPRCTLESVVASLEAEVSDSQTTCSALMSELSSTNSSKHLTDVKQLSQKLEAMQILLNRLRTQL